MEDIYSFYENYKKELIKCLNCIDLGEIKKFAEILDKARNNKNNIFIMGNGGSGATASHFCCDFNKGVSYLSDLNRFKFICLNDNVPTLLAYANDVSYDDVFVEPLKNFLKNDDVVIGISGSGNSKNVLRAIEYANNNHAVTVGLTGYNGGFLKKISQFSINTNVADMQITEDFHMILCHLLMKYFTIK